MEQKYWILIAVIVAIIAIGSFAWFYTQNFLSNINTMILVIAPAVVSAALTAYFTYALNEKERRKREHFSELKEQVLSVIVSNLNAVKNQMSFVEGSALLVINDIPYYPKDYYTKWLENFRISSSIPKYLFFDIKNHYPKMSNYVSSVESDLNTKGPKFLRSRVEIQKMAEAASFEILAKNNLSENEQIKLQLHQEIASTILFILINKPEDDWFNYKAQLEEKSIFNKVLAEANKIKRTKPAKMMLKTMNELNAEIQDLDIQIEKLFYTHNLKGDCSFC